MVRHVLNDLEGHLIQKIFFKDILSYLTKCFFLNSRYILYTYTHTHIYTHMECLMKDLFNAWQSSPLNAKNKEVHLTFFVYDFKKKDSPKPLSNMFKCPLLSCRHFAVLLSPDLFSWKWKTQENNTSQTKITVYNWN